MRNRNMLDRTRLLVAVSAILSASASAAISRQAEAQNYSGGSFGAARSIKRPSIEPDTLKNKVAVKDLPEYTGKQKFYSGNTLKTAIGPQYQEQFIAMEQPSEVIAWYKSALASYKWNVVSSERNTVAAKKSDGAYVSVVVNPYNRADGRALVTINYNEYQIQQTQNGSEEP